MKHIWHITILMVLIFYASTTKAQNNEINIDSLKAEIKQELKQELMENDVLKAKAEVDVKQDKWLNFNLYGLSEAGTEKTLHFVQNPNVSLYLQPYEYENQNNSEYKHHRVSNCIFCC